MHLFSPAKINLFLAVTGKRSDGFHELLSLVAPLAWGDEITIGEIEDGEDRLSCDYAGVPLDETNLILRAARLFREQTGVQRFFHFQLKKQIWPGGGLGGGSGNAVCTLEGLNEMCGNPLQKAGLYSIAETLGSDCPLFLEKGPVIIRGRGELVQAVPHLAEPLAAWKVGLMNPGFASPTGSLYKTLAHKGRYANPENAEEELAELMRQISTGGAQMNFRNDLGALLADKYLFYNTLRSILSREEMHTFGISGSGSSCFLLRRRRSDEAKIFSVLERFFSGVGFMIETSFLGANYKKARNCSDPTGV